MLEHSLGAVIWVWQVNGIDYYDDGQHDGRRGRALGAERAGVGGAGGADAAFFCVVCVRRRRSEAAR